MLTVKGEAARVAAQTASTPKCHARTPVKKSRRIRVYATKRAHSGTEGRFSPLRTTLAAVAAVLALYAGLILAGMAYDARPGATVLVTCGAAIAATLRELRRWGAER